MMTMNEWPLLKHWVLYHGHLLGFEHLYIVDSSTNPKCISFLRYARDVLGANVIFSDADLNELEGVLTRIGGHASGSSDFIIKMDTDEFLTVYDQVNKNLTTSISTYLSGFTTNERHDLHRPGPTRVSFVQGSFPSKDICDKNIYSTPELFPLRDLQPADWFKAVFNSRVPFRINLGGHAHNPGRDFPGDTCFGILHFHARCVEIEAENCKRVLERHHYIDPSDSPEQAKSKLVTLLGCPYEDTCNTCTNPRGMNSVHKAVWYAMWLDCEERLREEYYPDIPAQRNMDFIHAIRKSLQMFDVGNKYQSKEQDE